MSDSSAPPPHPPIRDAQCVYGFETVSSVDVKRRDPRFSRRQEPNLGRGFMGWGQKYHVPARETRNDDDAGAGNRSSYTRIRPKIYPRQSSERSEMSEEMSMEIPVRWSCA